MNSELFLSVSGEIEDIDTFGLALGLPGNVITKILQEKKETTDRMKEMFKVCCLQLHVHCTYLQCTNVFMTHRAIPMIAFPRVQTIYLYSCVM